MFYVAALVMMEIAVVSRWYVHFEFTRTANT